MRILVVSDTHRQYGQLRQVIANETFDALIHCGDSEGGEDIIPGLVHCPVYLVRGNCDQDTRLAAQLVVPVGNHKVFVCHGHLLQVRSDLLRLKLAAQQAGCDWAIYGHTHIPKLTEVEGIHILNPGSLAYPKQEGRAETYAILELDEETGELKAQVKIVTDKDASYCRNPV